MSSSTSSSTHTATTTPQAGPARRHLNWRVVDIVVASTLGVASALVFFAWNQVYTPLAAPLEAALPGVQAVLYAVWLFPAVLGGVVIRKPGAAIYVEVVAAVVEALIGAQWGGFWTIEAGVIQGLGAEIIFAVFLYKVWNLPVAALAGAGAGLAMGINDSVVWNVGAEPSFILTYILASVVGGALIAGLGSWAILRGLARTGALSRFAAGRDGAKVA